MKKLLFLAFSVGLLSGCSSVSVSRDFDTATEFTLLKTYAWQDAEQPETGDPRIDNDLNDERIRNAVNTTLATKEFQLSERGDADFLVVYYIDFKRKLNSSSISFGMGTGGHGRYGGMGYNTGFSEYDEGNLTIDIMDASDGKMIWRGVGTRAVYTGSNPQKATSVINGSVVKILKKFPPKQK